MKKTWIGNYHKDEYGIAAAVNMQKVVSYNEYLKCINEINSKIDELVDEADDLGWKNYYKSKKISNYYKNQKSNYIVLGYSNGGSWCTMDLIDCTIENNKIIIYGDEDVRGAMASGSGYFIAIPTDMPVGTEIEYRECYSTSEIKNLQNYGNAKGSIIFQRTYKTIIYLYPEKDTQLNVRLGYAELATCLYPEYNYQFGWNVLAKTNGDLIDLNTNRNLYSLYYESKNKNEYNYIRFASIDEINENMPLEFSHEPDTLIRVVMTYKGLSEPINVKEQQLKRVERKGFVAVEWGGSEIK